MSFILSDRKNCCRTGLLEMTTAADLAGYITELASKVEEGVVVELGSFHGKGTIALAKEAKVFVFSVDDFTEKQGWIGEHYGPEDEEIYWQNVEAAGLVDRVVQVKLPVEEAVKNWNLGIGLLYWDLGMVRRFKEDFMDWSPHILLGGLFIAKDTPSNHLGTFPVIKFAVFSGKWVRENYWNGVTFLRRVG